MGTKTTRLDLLKPGENDYYNQQTEQADNWQKVDDYAVYTDRDKNAIWGGLDGGGLIEDPTVVKEVGKRYIGADGKAYICLKPSNINNSTNYTPCNVVDNLDKLQNLTTFIKTHVFTNGSSTLKINEYESFYYYEFQGDYIASGQTFIMNLDGLSIKTPSVGYFNLPSASGNGNTAAQWTRCYSDSFRVLAGNMGLNPTTYSGGYIPKL